jgi:DNA polymerase/3'-5' exonuclease PolX
MTVTSPSHAPSTLNQGIAERFRQAAELLAQQGGNPYRIAAYRRAAGALEELTESAADLLDREGTPGLQALPGIGGTLAAAIREMVTTGRWAQLERLRRARWRIVGLTGAGRWLS